MNYKRYHSLYDLASYFDLSESVVRDVIESFRIDTVKNNGKRRINDCDVPFFKKCYDLKVKSGMKYQFIKKVPLKHLKQLIKTL